MFVCYTLLYHLVPGQAGGGNSYIEHLQRRSRARPFAPARFLSFSILFPFAFEIVPQPAKFAPRHNESAPCHRICAQGHETRPSLSLPLFFFIYFPRGATVPYPSLSVIRR